MLPNFIVIGAAKSATSSLCEGLARHPDIFMSTPKEIHFFSQDDRYVKGIEWYKLFFKNSEDYVAVGEGSTTYSQSKQYPYAAERMSIHLKNIKVIYIVRDPFHQIASNFTWIRRVYMKTRKYGLDFPSSLSKALRDYPMLVGSANYEQELSPYMKTYGEHNIHVEFFEEFIQSPETSLKRCFKHLGVEQNVSLRENVVQNKSEAHMYDRNILRLMRILPGTEWLKKRLPESSLELLKPILMKGFEGRPAWKEEDRQWVYEQIREPSIRFLERFGKTKEYWDL